MLCSLALTDFQNLSGLAAMQLLLLTFQGFICQLITGGNLLD